MQGKKIFFFLPETDGPIVKFYYIEKPDSIRIGKKRQKQIRFFNGYPTYVFNKDTIKIKIKLKKSFFF